MTAPDSGDARRDQTEPQDPSGETQAPTGIAPSSIVNGHRHQRSTESELSRDSRSDPVAELALKAEQLFQAVREVARREADQQTTEILAAAEIKAREQILDPAAARAASKTQEIMARAEREAKAMLSGVEQLFGRGSDADNAGENSTVDGPEAAANGRTQEGPRKRPPLMSPAQRDQLKEVIASRGPTGVRGAPIPTLVTPTSPHPS